MALQEAIMKRPENDKWLDDALAKAIGSEKSEPDFEKWQQEHPEAIENLISQARQNSSASRSNIWQTIYISI